MTGDVTQIEAGLRALLLAGELDALSRCVHQLDDGGRATAREWAARTHDFDGWPDPPELAQLPEDERWERRQLVRWGRVMLVGLLEPPAAAVKKLRGLEVWGRHVPPVVPGAFVDRGHDWAAGFVAAADRTTPPAGGGGATLALLMRHAVLAHDLPVPTGRLFQANWVRFSARWHGEHALVDALRVDPLMPEMLYRHLASGESGINPALPDAVATLAREGWVDRQRILDVVLEQLPVPQRVSSVRVLAGIAGRLQLASAEVPGGLPYVLGVLSAAHGSLATVMLPIALELLTTADELADLARIVAVRPEKGLRRTLRKTLTPKGLGQRLPSDALLAALDTLAEGEDDVAVRAELDKLRAALGAAPTGDADDPAAGLGLWDLEPTAMPDPPEQGSRRATLRDQCWELMRAGDSGGPDKVQDQLLDALARGQLTGDDLLATAHELLAEGKLSPARTSALLEPLFLGGAMRSTWPVALRVAEASATGSRPLPGLDRLLRMLGQYAADLPGPSQLPPHLARLAAGRSKAAQEARRLGARLVRTTPESYDPAPDAAANPVPDHLGLWREGHEHRPDQLAYPPVKDPASIARRVAASHHGMGVQRTVLGSLLLDEVVALVHELGAPAVRALLAERQDESWDNHVVQALGAWSHGLLTPESYWRMVTSGVPVHDVREQWQAELGHHEGLMKAHRLTLRDGLATDPPVMPEWWSRTFERVQFLHTCEALLLAERGGHLLSTPDVADGSLGLGRLLERLARTPTVGPIDLRLALGRLRPTQPSDAAKVGPEVPTDPLLTSPGGDSHVSASDTVRSWLADGGLQLTARRGNEPGTWLHDATAPMPWSGCAALAGTPDLGDSPSNRTWEDAWFTPGRPDLPLRHGFNGFSRDLSVADVGGTMSPAGWDSILVALGTQTASYYAPDFATLVRLQDQGRLHPVPAALAACARWESGLPVVSGQALGWERAILRGALRGLWPVAVVVVGAGLQRAERPTELVALIEVLARHVHEVPDPRLPDVFTEVAAEAGDDPLRDAVRRLLAAASRRPA